MALSKCGKCGHGFFEVTTQEPGGSQYKLIFVQCSSCGNVVGVLDFFNIGTMLVRQKKAIKAIADQAGVYVDLD